MYTYLTRRYLVALGIVAAVLIFSYVHARQADVLALSHAKLINVSGQQRMLSQRIALLADRTAGDGHHSDEQLTETRLQTLQADIKLMSSNHQFLVHDWMEGVLSERPEAVDELFTIDSLITSYLAIAREFTSGATPDRAALATGLTTIALDGDMLEHLDSVVSRYQRIAEESGHAAMLRERLQLSVGLLVLLAELVFIFRPMVASTVASLHQLQRSNGWLRDVGHRLSHDLRAPVASARGLASLAMESLDEGDIDETRFALREVARSLDAQDRQIEELNHVIHHPQVAARTENIGIREQLEASVSRLSHMPGFARLHVGIDAPAELRWQGERNVLQSILENLISNGIKYADPEVERSVLDIVAKRRGKHVHISVSDNGLGVARQDRFRLFNRQERFHAGHAPGTGMGLYLARQAAERLAGTLDYKPGPNGSVFRLVVPDDMSAETATEEALSA